jgi:hypothetical protein
MTRFFVDTSLLSAPSRESFGLQFRLPYPLFCPLYISSHIRYDVVWIIDYVDGTAMIQIQYRLQSLIIGSLHGSVQSGIKFRLGPSASISAMFSA